MSQIARIAANPVVAKIDGVDPDTKVALSDAMSYVVEGHEHMGGGSNWDGRSTLFDWNTGKFPAGFIPTAQAVLMQRGFQVQLLKNPLPEPLGPMPTQDAPLVDNFPANLDYEYQFKAVRLLEKHGSYIARCATGAGKSRIAALCIKRISRKTMFITTRQVLLYQMGEALDAAGFKVSYVGDGVWDTSGDVVLAMVQTLGERLGDARIDPFKQSPTEQGAILALHKDRQDQARAFLDSVEFVIGEEAHEAGGTGYYEALKACRRAPYRLGLTATPMMRDGEANVRLIAMFGPIRLEVTEEYLIGCGILARPIFKFKQVTPPPTLRRGTAWQKADEVGIILNHDRNKWVCAETIRAARYGLSTMILIKRQNHGKILHEMLKRAGLRGVFIFGESNNKKRKEALDALRNGTYDYIIGSVILDVGVDVPGVGLLILAGGGKAEVATRQRIGRGLRAKKKGPNVCFVLIMQDGVSKHLIAHSKQRRAIVEQTQGFVQNILPANGDFDYAGLGFQRKIAA